jgi:hypothetical protein
MKTTKAYLAGLGMTGILIGSALVVLVLGSGLAAFERAPDGGRRAAPLERVVLDMDAPAANRSDRSSRAGRRVAGSHNGAASGGRRGSGGAPGAGAPGVGAVGGAGQPPPSAGGGQAPRPGDAGRPPRPGGGGPTQPAAGETVTGVTGTLGGAVQSTTDVVGGTLGQVDQGALP